MCESHHRGAVSEGWWPVDGTQLVKGVLDLAVLAVVAREDGYGYDVVRRLRAAGLEEVGDASVYGTLRRLYSAGALTSYVVPSDEGPHRKYYGINAAGAHGARDAGKDVGGVRRHDGRSARPGGSAVMNDTTVIGAAEQVEDVRAYVRAVRAWLGDLPADEVEDLTAGMEADLAERAAESGGPLGGLLGEPEAYAAELRSAAGLPPRVDVVVAPDAVRHEPWTDRLVRDAHELVARHPWLRELRPTWWLARGAVAGWVVAAVLGTGRTLLLPLVGAALSMWLGLVLRRREPLGAGARFALGAGERARRGPAAADAGVLHVGVVRLLRRGRGDAPGYPSQVVANGEPAQNLYAYDAAGNRLEGVRIYDQSGRALFVGLDPLMDGAARRPADAPRRRPARRRARTSSP